MRHSFDGSLYAFAPQKSTATEGWTYSVHRTARARQISVRVAPHTGVVVVAPLRVAEGALAAFVQQHRRWIERQVRRLAAAAAHVPRRWPYGPTLPYLGEEHAVQVEPARTGSVTRDEGRLRVALRTPTLEAARRLLKRWYVAEAERWCTLQALQWQQRLGVTWARLRVRDQRARWGSCSAQGHLNFNYRLVMAPLAVLDYVVLHELAHRREMNHSPRFWALVGAHCPAYREALAWLKAHGPYLGF